MSLWCVITKGIDGRRAAKANSMVGFGVCRWIMSTPFLDKFRSNRGRLKHTSKRAKETDLPALVT